MSYVVINAITVPPGAGDELERRFGGRAGQVSKAEGFESFELLRPANNAAGDRYLVYTRWASRAAFEAWRSSPAFEHGHRGARPGGGERPVATDSEVLAYEVVEREEG